MSITGPRFQEFLFEAFTLEVGETSTMNSTLSVGSFEAGLDTATSDIEENYQSLEVRIGARNRKLDHDLRTPHTSGFLSTSVREAEWAGTGEVTFQSLQELVK